MFISTWLAKKQVSALSIGGSYDITMYGWHSDNSILLQEPGIYLRPGDY